jgi:SAM-dependent methyltransferase
MTAGPAVRGWAEDLAAWGIPPEILDQAPESPWGCPPGLFAHAAEESLNVPPTPSNRRALEVLPAEGSVLDVGVGGGAASLPLSPPAARIVGVDQSRAMLRAFAGLAEQRGIAHEEIEGNWPAVAERVGPADVVVCHHVLYNVADIEPFVLAMTERARRRVVVEITATHPQSSLNPMWRRFHGLERPVRPTASDALAALEELGLDVSIERWEAPGRWENASRDDLVAFIRRRLCLGPERDPEVAAAIESDFDPVPRQLVTLAWEGGSALEEGTRV